MSTPVTIRVHGCSRSVGTIINLDAIKMDIAAGWCGSYNILEMGEHFDAYVMAPRSILFPPINGFPASRRFTRLPGKLPAPSVYGNIGEAIAALTAVENMGFDVGDVVHVKASKWKTPDLLLKRTMSFEKLVNRLLGGSILIPDWIPCEAKCRKTNKNVRQAVKEAHGQIQAYWNSVPPNEGGLGIVCCYVHSPPQSIEVRIFIN